MRTVENVEGVYIKIPPRRPTEDLPRFHEEDNTDSTWIHPYGGRHYSHWERDASHRGPGKIERYQLELLPRGNWRPEARESRVILDKPSAAYGMGWQRIGDNEDIARGFHGDETYIFEVATGDIIAVRRLYYFRLYPYAVDETGATLASPRWTGFRRVVKDCENFRPKEDAARRWDTRSRDSYEFVSRVLRPKRISDAVAAGVFDVARGSGNKTGGCVVASFGPDIGPKDVVVERVGKDGIRTTLRGTRDSLLCERSLDASSALYRFYDGRIWRQKDIEKAIETSSSSSN